MKRKLILTLAALCFAFVGVFAQTASQDDLLKILKSEIDRGMAFYRKAEVPVYLISYRVNEFESYNIATSFGTLTTSNPNTGRVLTIQVRVGDKELDNFHELRDDASAYSTHYTTVSLPMENDPKAIAMVLWEATEKEYRSAALRYEKVKANVAVKVETEDKAPDYSDVTPVQYYEKPLKISDFKWDVPAWEARLKNYSAHFAAEKDILDGASTLRFYIERKYFVNSEGTSIVQNSASCYVSLSVTAQADDGMTLPLRQSYFGHSPQDLPDDNTMMRDAQEIAKTVIAMKTAPVVDAYAGPAILSNDVAGVFFHEIFGHRVEGTSLKSERDGQTFKGKVGDVVLNKDFSVIFDPTITTYKGAPLNGSFKYDDEGVKSERVVVVEKGILKDFLMTRTPIDGFPKSNGHARAQTGYQPVSRQSNLIVETEKPYTDAQLREMLIEEIKKQEKEYGYFFAKVSGGSTSIGRINANSFNVTPLEVYRIFADGRPNELVRGVTLVGTPLAMVSHIEAAGDTYGTRAGNCGAASGIIPYGGCSPALFVKQIEIQKKSKSQNRPPIIEKPVLELTSAPAESFEDVAFKAMQDEMNRNMENLKLDKLQSPYYLCYFITDAQLYSVSAKLGALVKTIDKPLRQQNTTALVGSHQRNNLNFVGSQSRSSSFQIPMTLENDYDAIRRTLWANTDAQYKRAAEQFEAKLAAINQQNIPEEELNLADQSSIPPFDKIIPSPNITFDKTKMETLTKDLSALFSNYPHLTNSGVRAYIYTADALYLNSEGIKYKVPFSLICIRAYAETVATDGEPLMDYVNLYFNTPEQIPALEVLKQQVNQMATLLTQLRTAPTIQESYTGPVMFEGEAVGEIVAQCFVDNPNGLLSVRRSILSTPQSGRALSKENNLEQLTGKKVISRELSVTAVHDKSAYNGIPLIGYYDVDAQGVVPASKTTLIEHGILKTMLTDRTPTSRNETSNGHSIFAISDGTLTRTLGSGVIELTSTETKSYAELKEELLAAAEEENYEYAYIVRKMANPMAGVPGLTAFVSSSNTISRPIYIYRISVKDGAEELVRSAKIAALPLKSFKKILGVADTQVVYNTLQKGKRSSYSPSNSGFSLSGAPASFIVPQAIFFETLEVEKDRDIALKKEPVAPSPLLSGK